MSDPTITPPPDAPSRQQPSTFSARGDAFFAWMVTFAGEVTTVISWISEKITEIAGSATAASDSATAAAASETAATGAANYQGDYDAGTLYAVGESVSYTGSVFVKKTTAPAGTTPVDGTDWLEIGVETVVVLSGTTPIVDLEAGTVFTLSTSGNTTFTFSNPAVSGTASAFTLVLTAGGAHTITWPASVDWAGGTAPDAPASGETDVYTFFTTDGGTTWYGFLAGDALA